MTILSLRALGLSLAAATVCTADMDPGEIIRRAVDAEERNWKLARNYGYSERVDDRRLDPQGQLKSKDVKLYDVTLLEGSPYRRLAGREDRPLPPGDEKKEQEKLTRSTSARQKETAAQRALRLTNYVNRPEWQREAWLELPQAFDFRLLEEEQWDNNSLYVIQATPRPGYQPRSNTAKLLVHLQAKLWVDKQNYNLVKGEVEVVETISLGLILVRLAKGSRAVFEMTWVDDEVWLPRRLQVFASARVGLLKVLRVEQETIYSKCAQPQTGVFLLSKVGSRVGCER